MNKPKRYRRHREGPAFIFNRQKVSSSPAVVPDPVTGIRNDRKLIFFFALELILRSNYLFGKGQVPGNPPQVEDDRHATFRALMNRIYSHARKANFDIPPDVDDVLSQLDVLIANTVNLILARPLSSDTDLAAELSTLPGLVRNPDFSNMPSAEVFVAGGIRTVEISCIIPVGAVDWMVAQNHPHIEFYQLVGGSWIKTLSADLQQEFSGKTFHLDHMRVSDPAAAYFIVPGFDIGSTGTALTAALLRFSGKMVEKVWEKPHLVGGAVEVKDDEVDLDYLRTYKSEDPNDHLTVRFKLVGGTLQCVPKVCE